ncbi:hypothetical protein E2C01_049758 [Portunus trituberculatus]|uniref:Uncharacterized protein n=1 Tax=Portunus trituberculatus TaxID=210409 RepID=A0A5B7GER0_PORTR|nr:hypothetical protein [Portunus trituberculatus]
MKTSLKPPKSFHYSLLSQDNALKRLIMRVNGNEAGWVGGWAVLDNGKASTVTDHRAWDEWINGAQQD